jgi:spore germination cell wall hydrolase CwlJ-like protein
MKIPPPNELQKRILSLDAETVLALNGYFEAAREYRGLGDIAYIAVMAAVMNRVESSSWPDSIQKVVAQFRQFSWTNWDDEDGEIRHPIRDPQYPTALKYARDPQQSWNKIWLAAKDAARRVLDAAVLNPVQNATFYFNPHICSPSWANNLRLVRNVGNHRFFAEPHDPKILWVCKRAEGWE